MKTKKKESKKKNPYSKLYNRAGLHEHVALDGGVCGCQSPE